MADTIERAISGGSDTSSRTGGNIVSVSSRSSSSNGQDASKVIKAARPSPIESLFRRDIDSLSSKEWVFRDRQWQNYASLAKEKISILEGQITKWKVKYHKMEESWIEDYDTIQACRQEETAANEGLKMKIKTLKRKYNIDLLESHNKLAEQKKDFDKLKEEHKRMIEAKDLEKLMITTMLKEEKERIDLDHRSKQEELNRVKEEYNRTITMLKEEIEQMNTRNRLQQEEFTQFKEEYDKIKEKQGQKESRQEESNKLMRDYDRMMTALKEEKEQMIAQNRSQQEEFNKMKQKYERIKEKSGQNEGQEALWHVEFTKMKEKYDQLATMLKNERERMIMTNRSRQEEFDKMKVEYDRIKGKEEQHTELDTSRRNQVELSAWTEVISGIVNTVVEVISGVSDRIETLTNLVEKALLVKETRKGERKEKAEAEDIGKETEISVSDSMPTRPSVSGDASQESRLADGGGWSSVVKRKRKRKRLKRESPSDDGVNPLPRLGSGSASVVYPPGLRGHPAV